jgi:flagellar motility protein MotE (MotC chaperone)
VKRKPWAASTDHDPATEQTVNPAEVNVDDFVARLTAENLTTATRLLRGLIEAERELTLRNELKPYEEKLPPVLQALAVPLIARIFDGLETELVRGALFGNFRAVERPVQAQIVAGLETPKAAALLAQMSTGFDRPRIAASLLQEMPGGRVAEVLAQMEDINILYLLQEMEPGAGAAILAEMRPQRAARFIAYLLEGANCARRARAANLLREMAQARREQIIAHLSPADRQMATSALHSMPDTAWARMEVRELISALSGARPEDVLLALGQVDAAKQAEILKRLDSSEAAQVLARMAAAAPQTVGELLSEVNKSILRADDDGRFVEEPYSLRTASIVQEMDLSAPGNRQAIRHLARDALQLSLPWLSADKRAQAVALTGCGAEKSLAFLRYPERSGWGRRRSRAIGPGLRWIRIEEITQAEGRSKPQLIDLLEIAPDRVRLKACRAISEEKLVPIEQASALFGPVTRRDVRPPPQFFRQLGIIRLGETVSSSGAVAGINGNFYFDYGNYIDARQLGLDLDSVPGLYFGDLIGWFVSGGVELSPPIFNRASFIMTDDGRFHIRKVFMAEVALGNGRRIRWDSINNDKKGGIILFNSLSGFKTRHNDDYVDVAMAKNRILAINRGGGVTMPLIGFVLSIPARQADELLAGVKVGDPVTIHNDFPPHLGRVAEAMACGPQLVRDGQPDLDLDFEDFGEKDTSVIPFSLTRAADFFDAARSFVVFKGGKLILGTVSGTALGGGQPPVSAGMTFGELAQLAMDLGAEQALALDGGGSSSLDVMTEEGVKVLSLPTGGADVPRGEERFINTYWLVFRR